MERGILRLSHKTVEPAGRRRYQVSPLAAGEEWEVEEYTVDLDSLIIQPPGLPDVGRYNGPLQVAPRPWRRYCKWHNGPLDARDEPWRRIYCTAQVNGRYEFCRQHRRSDRFLYNLCMSLRGTQALEACRELDKRLRAEYAVYLLAQQGGHVKVGTTRLFRVLERIAEQPHAAATVISVYDSALEARRAEIAVSKAGIASEHRPRSRRARLPAPGPAAALLAAAAEQAAKLLGVDWDRRIMRVKPPATPPLQPMGAPAPGSSFVVAGYWGGMLLVDAGAGVQAWVDERELLHSDSILYDPTQHRLGE